jgi:cobalt-zinc-cadmium efflux system outer membrane protein
MHKFYLWIYLILLALPVQAANEGLYVIGTDSNVLTLQEALQVALRSNPELAAAVREREAIHGMRLQAGLRPNPSLSTYVETTGDAAQQTTVQLNQPIELGNKRGARIDAAEAQLDTVNAGLEAKKAEIRAGVTSAFYEVLAAQQRLALAQSSLDIARQAREAAAKRVEAGKISPVEEVKSRVAESAVKIEANQAAGAFATTRQKLAAQMGNSIPDFSEVEGSLEAIPELLSYETLTAKLDNAPLIQRARLEVEAREAQASIESSLATPNLTVSIGAQRNEELGVNQAVLGFSVPIPVFDRNQGNLQAALSRIEQARDELAALKNRLAAQLASSYQRHVTADESVRLLETDILSGAQTAFDAASKGFLHGKFSYLEVLDAQRTLFQAKSQYLAALVEAHQAEAAIIGILGPQEITAETSPQETP